MTVKRFLPVACLVLSGCAMPPTNGFSGAAPVAVELATVLTPQPRPPVAAFVHYVDGYRVGDSITGHPGKVHILPGTRQLKVICFAGTSEFKTEPEITATIEAGHLYELGCSSTDGVTPLVHLHDKGRSR